jgi:curli biogenesis system outer membrane secretion channel CsgG
VASAQQKRRVAVLNFDYATVHDSVSAIFGSNQDVGKGIADLLVDKLVSGGAVSVIERNAIDKVLAEQNFANSDRADASTAAQIGRVLGVDAIVIGSITQFGRDDKKTDVGGGALSRATGRFGIGGVRRTESSAVVQITGRMVNATTGEIMASVSGKGESTRSGTGLIGSGGSSAGLVGGALDMRSSNFAQTILGEAVTKCVADMAKQLETRAASIPVKAVQVSGLVADAAPDGTLVINVGSKAGVKVGDKLEVRRKTREVRDPATGRVLRSIEEAVGSMTVTEVDEQSAVGKFSGSGAPKVGDVVATAK